MSRSRVVGVLGVLAVLALGVGGFLVLRAREAKAASGGGGAGGAPAFEPFESAQIVPARELKWQATADLVGTVFAMRSVVVKNELAGAVRKVNFQSGDVVEAGQVLVEQDDSTDRADLEAMKAMVRVAEASITQAQSEERLAGVELERMSGVQARALAAVDLDRARTRVDKARADLGRWRAEADQARARVAQVEARLAKLTMRSPFRARAGIRTVHEGQYLGEGTAIVELQELTDRIYLDFAVPQEYSARVAPGTSVMATGPMLGPGPARIEVVAVDAAVNRETRNLRVRAVVDNPRGALMPGMSVQVNVPIEAPRDFVVVPATAVRRAAYGDSVFLIAPDPSNTVRAKQKFVKLGETVGEDVIVLDGLKAGDRVAAAGSFKLRDGVKVMEGPPAGAGGGPGGGGGHGAPGEAAGHADAPGNGT
jgi:membrane fusion protein (multidrug efflux system)